MCSNTFPLVRYAPDWKDGTTKGEKRGKKESDRRRDGGKTRQRSGSLERETASTRARFVPQLLPEALCVTTAQFVRSPPSLPLSRARGEEGGSNERSLLGRAPEEGCKGGFASLMCNFASILD